MKKLYFFIFMIVLGLSQFNAVNANAHNLLSSKVMAPQNQTITFPPFTAAQTAGFADITLSATASSGLAITYTSSNTAVATIVAGKIHYVGIGSAVITATQAGNNINWLPAASVSLPLTVNPTLTFANLGSLAFTGADITFAAATSNAAVATFPITYTTSDPTVATIVAGKLHCVGLGTCTITASQAGSVYPSVAYTTSTKTATVTLTQGAAPTISWTGSAGTALQTADVVLGATSNNTNTTQFPIIYSIKSGNANPSVATIVNNRLHMTGTGTIIITANQPGNGKFIDATSVDASYTITPPAAPNFSTALGGKVFGTTLDFDPAATQGGWASTITYTSSNPALASIVNNKIHLVSGPITAGQVIISASYTYPVGTGGTASTAATTNATLAATVATAPTSPVLNFTSLGSKAYTNIDIPLVATTTSSSTSPITFSITGGNTALATIINGNLHLLPMASVPTSPNNTITVTADQGGIPAGVPGALPADVAQTLTLTAPTISATAPGAKLTNSADFAPAATATLTNIPVTFSVAPANIAVMVNGNIHLTGGTGTATITASQAADAIAAGYPAPANATTTFAVTAPTNPAITFAALGSKPYTNSTTQLAATSTNTTIPITYTSSNPAVATVSSTGLLTLVGAVPPPNNFTIITASQGGGTLGSLSVPADVLNTLTVTPAVITFPTIGTKAYVASDFAPGATSTNANNFIYYTSSNPAVATIVNNVTGTLTGGTGYTNGTYNNIALTGGTGTGAIASTVIVSGGIVTSVTINTNTVYSNGDILTLAVPGSLGNGTNFSFLVTGFNSVVRYNKNVPAAPNNTTVITASQDGGVNGTATLAADVSQVLTLTAPVITFPALGTKQFTSTDINPGASAPYVSINSIATTTLVGGSGYTPGTYFSVPLTGGTGTGATANITVIGTVVTSAVIVNPGLGYTVNNTLTCANTLIGGTGAGFTVVVTGVSASLPLTYTSSNPAVATIVNGFIHFTGAPAAPNNTTVITASQLPPAGVNLSAYSLPAPVSQTLTVTPPTITFNALGTKTYSATDIAPGATSTISNTLISYTSSNTAVATIKNTAIAAINLAKGSNNTQGSQYTPGTYTNVALTGGTGTGATATITVGPTSSNTTTNLATGVSTTTFNYGVQSVTIVSAGSGYSIGDVLTAPAASLGTPVQPAGFSAFSVRVTALGSFIHYVGAGTTTITASQGGGVAGTTTLPADVSQTLTVIAPTLTFPALGTQKLPVADINPGATSTLTGTPITYTSDNATVATILPNSILQVGFYDPSFQGSGYQNGVYPGVPLTGGTGTGAIATLTVIGGSVTSAVITNGGSGFTLGDNLTASSIYLGGGTGFAISATQVGGAIHINGAGTANIKASQGGGATGSALVPADVIQPIVILPHTITFPALGTKILTDVDFAPAAVSTNTTAQMNYSSSNLAVATIVSGNIHYVGVGTTTITASQGGGVAGTATLPADATSVLTVTSPVITFPSLFGTKTTLSGDFSPGATSSISTPAITYTSTNTAIATIIPGSVFKVGTITGGVNYLSGMYNNVSLTGGTGTGAKANIVVVGGAVASVTITTGGTGYVNGDVLSAATSSLGNVGTGFRFIATAGPVIHPITAGTVTIEATQQGSAAGTIKTATTVTPFLPADVTATLTIAAPAITFPALGTKPYSNVDLALGATSPVATPITYISSNTAAATIVNTLTLSSTYSIGTNYTNGTYTSVPLTGGTGTGAKATIVVANNTIASVTVTTNGSGYVAGDILSAAVANIGGSGSGFSIPVNGFSNFIHFVGAGTTNITASQGGGATGTASLPADVVNPLTITAPAITFPTLGSVVYSNVDIAPGATSSVTLPITYTSATPSVATITSTGQIHLLKAGTSVITASQGGGVSGTATIPADVAQTLTVTGGPLITFAATSSKSFSTVDAPLGATSTLTTVPITYTVTGGNTALASIVGGNLHFLTTAASPNNTIIVTASQGGGVTGTGTIPPDVSQVITVAAPAITFTTTQLPATKAIQSVDLAPGATSTVTSVPITYTSSDPTIATIVNGNIHFVGGIGTTIIRATQQGTAATSSAAAATATLPADVQLPLSVTAPVITFTTTQLPASLPFNTLDRLPGATSTLANIPVTYTSSDPNVATIVNGNIHFVGLGTTTITASQQAAAIAAGYSAPADVALSLTVTAPTLTMTALGSKAFTATDFALMNTVTGTINQSAPITFTSSDPTVATIVNNQLHYTGIGNCIITATQAAFPGAGVPPVATSTLTVTPAVLTATPTTGFGTQLINALDVQLGYTSTVSTTTFPVTYTSTDPTVATVVGGLLHIVGPGTCNIIGNQITNTNYQPLPTVNALTVTAIPAVNTPTINLTALGTRQYSNNGDITPTATVSNGSTVTFTSSNPAVATIVNGAIHLTPPSVVNGVVTYPNPNTTTITATQGGGATGVAGLLAADVSTVLTVVPAGISFPPLGIQKFNTIDLAPGATSSYVVLNANNIAQPITYTSSDPTVATIVNGNIHFVGLGTVTITASLGNVIVPDVSQVMTVVPPAITFAATASRAYSTADVPPGATSTLPTAITYTSSNPSVATIVNGNIHFTGIGQTTITASQAAVGNSTAPLNVPQVLTVTAPTLTFATTRTLAFTTTDQDPGATSTLLTTPITYTSSNPALVSIVNNKLHFNLPTSNLTNNTAVITATQVGESNIPVQTALQTLTVPQAIIFPNVMLKAYGDPDFSPAVSTFGTGYPVAYSSATTTVATTTTSNGLVNSLVHIVAPGTSVITASQAGDGNTTAATNATATLTVTAAPMTITPKNVTIPYGSTAVPVLPVNYYGFKSASGNAPLDDSTKFSVQPTVYIAGKAPNGNYANLPVGTYTLFATGAVSTLYNFTYGTGTLTVAAAPQTLTWAGNNEQPLPNVPTAITKSFGDADFDPLARSTGDPIVYSSSNLAVATVNSNGFIQIVGVGTATIRATLTPTSGNFTGSAVLTRTLNVVQGKQVITVYPQGTVTTATPLPVPLNAVPTLSRNGASYTPVAVSNSLSPVLPVQVSVADQSIVKVVNGQIIPLHVGTAKVLFTQAGDARYLAADTVALYVSVTDPAGGDLLVHQAVSPDGDNINDFLYIEGISGFPVNHVKIIDRNGGNVFETDNYDNKANVFTGKAKNGNKLPGGTYFYIVDYNVGNQRNHVTGYFVLKY
jgi:gliding motility-associated-like protein